MPIGTAVVSVGDVAPVETPMVVRNLGVDVTSNVTGTSIDVVAFVVRGDVVDGRITVFAVSVLAADDDFKIKVVVIGVSSMDVVSFIDGDTYVSSNGESVVIFDDFDDLYVPAVVVC